MALAAPVLGAACGPASDGERAEGPRSAESAESSESGAHAHDEGPVTLQVSDPLAQEDMAGLAAASEAVIRGTVTEAEDGMRFGDAPLRYTEFTVAVDEALAGEPGDRVRVVLSSQMDGRDIRIEGRPLPEVGDEGIWFLAPVPPQVPYDGYILTGQPGLLLFEGDEVVGGGPPGSPVATEVERLGTPEAVLDHVRTAAR
jgi:hypothetical protein